MIKKKNCNLFFFDSTSDAREEILKKIHGFIGRFGDTKWTCRNQLTFTLILTSTGLCIKTMTIFRYKNKRRKVKTQNMVCLFTVAVRCSCSLTLPNYFPTFWKLKCCQLWSFKFNMSDFNKSATLVCFVCFT